MGLVFVLALAASLFAGVPWSLSLSSAGTILSAIFVIAVGASAARAGMAERVFRAFCIGLVVAGVASSVVGLIQVFAPTLPDGDWIAISAIPGRATGNLRQPNHLSSLLLWSIVAAVWLGEAKVLRGELTTALALVFIYVVVLSASRTGAVGMLTLAGWGLFDRRLSRNARRLLVLAPLIYGAMWWGMTVWATHSHQLFGGADALRRRRRHLELALRHLVEHAVADRLASLARRRLRRLQLRLVADAFPGPAGRVLRPHPQHRPQLRGRAGRAAGDPRARAHDLRALAGARQRDRRRPRDGRRLSGAARRLRDRDHGRGAQHARVPALVRLLPAADGVRVRPLPRAAGRRARPPPTRRHAGASPGPTCSRRCC